MMKTDEDINIHLPISTIFKMAIAGLFFMAISYDLICECTDSIKNIVGWVSLAFAVVGELAACVYAWLLICRKPMAVIGDKELRLFVPIKWRYETILYADVKLFYVEKIESMTVLCAKLRDGEVKHTNLINLLFKKKRLTHICETLNDRLNQ